MKNILKRALARRMAKGKKGFTLVELLVVIAIIAVLAAVSVVSYLNFTRQANESVDQQAVTQINTLLQGHETLEGKGTINDMFEILEENGLTAENYKPLYSGRYFFWDSNLNRVVYAEKGSDADSYNVLYPEDLKNTTQQQYWYSLTREIAKESLPDVSEEGAATVNSAGQLYALVEEFKNGTSTSKGVKTITLNEDINLMGAELSFGNVDELTITGKDGGTTLNGVYSDDKTTYNVGSGSTGTYYSGIVSKINDEGKVTFKNLTIDGAVVGDYETGSVGVLVGTMSGKNSSLTIDNVTIKNTTIYGKNKVSTLVGFVTGTSTSGDEGTISINDTRIENTVINTSEGESGKVFGAIGGGKNIEGKVVKIVIPTADDLVLDNVDLVLQQTSSRHYFDGPTYIDGATSETKDVLCSALYTATAEDQGLPAGERIWKYGDSNKDTLRVKRFFPEAMMIRCEDDLPSKVKADAPKYAYGGKEYALTIIDSFFEAVTSLTYGSEGVTY